jgi:hypothetical protein
MNFVGGKLKLKSKVATPSSTIAPIDKESYLEKRKREQTPDPTVTYDKKGHIKEMKPITEEESKAGEKIIILDFKTDYQKRIEAHKLQRTKDQIEKKVKLTHR